MRFTTARTFFFDRVRDDENDFRLGTKETAQAARARRADGALLTFSIRRDILPTVLCANDPFDAPAGRETSGGARERTGATEGRQGRMYVTYCSWLCMRGSWRRTEDRADRSRACFPAAVSFRVTLARDRDRL